MPLAEGAFGLDQEQFREKLIQTAEKIKDRIDVLVLAQGSMAYAEEAVSRALEFKFSQALNTVPPRWKKAAESLGDLQ